MKKRISATIEPETEKLIEKILKRGKHRNSSHIIEDAIKEFSNKFLAMEEKNGRK